MALIEWSPKMSVGIASIDADHRKLVTLVNDLYEAMSIGEGSKVLERVLKELIEYTRTHFVREETLFRTHGYEHEAEHKAQHDKLLQTVDDLKRRVDAGERVSPVATGQFLKQWLTEHIMGSDMAYSAFLISKGVR
jgi:hemerythrin